MVVIVRYLANEFDYILLGTGFGAFKSEHPSALLGNWAISKHEGTMPMVAVCDGEGRIGWIPSNELQVVRIDGVTPDEALDEHVSPTSMEERTADPG